MKKLNNLLSFTDFTGELPKNKQVKTKRTETGVDVLKEELNPETYIKAGEKLKSKGFTKRSDILNRYGRKMHSNDIRKEGNYVYYYSHYRRGNLIRTVHIPNRTTLDKVKIIESHVKNQTEYIVADLNTEHDYLLKFVIDDNNSISVKETGIVTRKLAVAVSRMINEYFKNKGIDIEKVYPNDISKEGEIVYEIKYFPPNKEFDFFIGERVIASFEIAGRKLKNLKGTIVGNNGKLFCIEFDKYINGHDCGGIGKRGYSWSFTIEGNFNLVLKRI